jgi:hypothetical protein
LFYKLGRDKLKLLPTEKDEIEEQLRGDKLKDDISVADGERKLIKTHFWDRWKKSTVRDFLTPILRKSDENRFIAIYRKTAPTKSTVLGGDPPLGRKHKIYRKIVFFCVFGPSIQPGKPSPKSASTPYPPSGGAKKWKKVKISLKISFIDKFITTHGSGK